MSANYVLVDFENLQPDMSELAGTGHKVVVFFGAKQQTSRHHFEKFDSLFELGSNLVREKILHSGKNALDMHIAYYLGRIFEREPGANVHVISRDTDFDPLLDYLRAKGFACFRSAHVGDVTRAAAPPRSTPRKAKNAQAARPPRAAKSASPAKPVQPARHGPAPKPAPATRPAPVAKKAPPHELDAFVKQLRSMTGKPSNRRKLEQTLAAYFKHHGGERAAKDVEQCVDELLRRGLVSIVGNKVAYSLG